MDKSFYKSPIGILEITCKNNALVSLKLCSSAEGVSYDTDLIKTVKIQLDEYFSGKRKTFDLRINPAGTDFQKIIWDELKKIPYGKTKNYSDIAELSGKKGAQRAVGSACNKNPILIIIPCHRVIAKNGSIGGFAYGNSIKNMLLNLEKANISEKKKY